MGAAIAAWCTSHPCEFAVLLGDNIYDTGVTSVTDPQWQTKFEIPYAAVNMPFASTRPAVGGMTRHVGAPGKADASTF